MSSDQGSTAIGLLRCLAMLAEEAQALALTETHRALQRAMATCRSEAAEARPHGANVH